MKIKRIKLENFRNYAAADAEFDPKINLICGRNAQGKSNLLEAISYLSMVSSFRNAPDQDLIRYGEKYFFLQGQISSEGSGEQVLTAAANSSRQRRWTVNREPKTRLADLIGLFHTVIFTPEDIALVKSGPEQRRRYLNRQISQLDRQYCRWMIDYNRVVRQRNVCLRQWNEKSDPENLEIWTEQLIQLGSRISICRKQIIAQLLPLVQQMHGQLSGGEDIRIRYLSGVSREDYSTPEQAQELMQRELQRVAASEQLRGVTLIGPHRDDLQIMLDGHSAREFASQGQQRTVALSLKLGELELARQLRGEYPVLLLDDVLSELDQQRRRQILSLTADKAQTFISAATNQMSGFEGRMFVIENGSFLSPAKG